MQWNPAIYVLASPNLYCILLDDVFASKNVCVIHLNNEMPWPIQYFHAYHTGVIVRNIVIIIGYMIGS